MEYPEPNSPALLEDLTAPSHKCSRWHLCSAQGPAGDLTEFLKCLEPLSLPPSRACVCVHTRACACVCICVCVRVHGGNLKPCLGPHSLLVQNLSPRSSIGPLRFPVGVRLAFWVPKNVAELLRAPTSSPSPACLWLAILL